MNRNSSENRMIPSVLSIPDKLSAFLQRLMRLRLHTPRLFSAVDILLALLSLLLLLLGVLIPVLRTLRLPVCIFAMLLSGVPLVKQALRSVRRKLVPAEELCVLLAAVLAVLLKEYAAAVMIPAFAVLLWQVEAYSLLHCEAAPDSLKETSVMLRTQVEAADPEKSPRRRILAFGAFDFFGLFQFAAFIAAILQLFHLDSWG